jgi:hypothetical protein
MWFNAQNYPVLSDLVISRCHMFYSQRVLDIPDGKPKWSGMSGQSDLIADSPDSAKELESEAKVGRK